MGQIPNARRETKAVNLHYSYSYIYILRESKTTQNVLWSRASVCLFVCVSVCPRPYAHTNARTRM